MGKLSVYEYDDAIILPHRPDKRNVFGVGGLLDKNGKFIKESGFQFCNNNTDHLDWGGEYDFSSSLVKRVDAEIIFAGFLNNNEWGHFIVDWSIRLWYAMDNDLPVYFCCREKQMKILKNIEDLIRLCGVNPERLHIIMTEDVPYKFSKVFLPQASLTAKSHSTEFLKPFTRAVENVQLIPNLQCYGEKIYLTRTRMKNCKEIGEKDIELTFAKNGFQIIAPETLSVVEQIKMFSGCKELASLDGSAPHGVVFCKNGIKHIIFEKTNERNFRQKVLDEYIGTSLEYVNACIIYNSKAETMGPFLVGITNNVRKFFLKENFVFDKGTSIFALKTVYYLKYIKVRCLNRVFGFISRKF